MTREANEHVPAVKAALSVMAQGEADFAASAFFRVGLTPCELNLGSYDSGFVGVWHDGKHVGGSYVDDEYGIGRLAVIVGQHNQTGEAS